MQKIANVALVIVFIVLAASIIIKPSQQLSTKEESSPMPSATESTNLTKQYQKAEQVIKKGKSYTAILHTTAGDITIQLSPDMPVTTNNFVFLAQQKFYDGVIFHRVIPGFMIQGGDPTGTGTGGPGYKFADENFTGEYKRGVVAMANSGKDTNGSQFFIMHADTRLPPSYVIFGMTTGGLDVVDKIAAGKTGANDRPLEPVSIQTVEIKEQ
ncbi:MAG: peptidylprolyl isomerase [bacterium]